ncbi:MAG: hypothetical protein ACYTGB_07730 [Planctomycetota bacterium]|jgi:tetratricopeptide (TPR) repeat protein
MRLAIIALGAVLLLSGGASEARGATIPKPGEKPKIPRGWVKCPKCGKFHPPNAPHCPNCNQHHPPAWQQCSRCKKCHPPQIPCPECPPAGFVKCKVEDCGTLYPQGRKCPNCSRRTAPRRSATCPVCAKAFSGPLPFRVNGRGGTDRDFCRHPVGRDVVMSDVWMCPRCGHARWCPEVKGGKETPAEFNKKVSADYAKKVRAEVEPVVQKVLVTEVARVSPKLTTMISEMDQTDIPDWLKYHAAVKCAEIRGDPAAVRAKLALEASYACRRELNSAVRLPVLNRIIPAMETLISKKGGDDADPRSVVKVIADVIRASDKAAAENKPAVLEPAEKYYLYLRLAGCWDRLGASQLAAESLDQALLTLKQVNSPPTIIRGLAAVGVYRKLLLSKESELRRKAIEQMRLALVRDNAYPGKSVAPTSYLLGELYRREGKYSLARPWMTMAAKIAGKDSLLSNMVSEAMQLPSMKETRSDEKEEAAALALLSRLTGRRPDELVGPGETDPGPDTPDSPGTVSGKPANCRECLAKIYRAYRHYVDKRGRAPESIGMLKNESFITAEASCGFRCPDCGAELNYKRPRRLKAGDELLLWHPKTSRCKRLILRADGKIEEL